MLQNAYLLAKIGADTAENKQHFAEILPTDALWRRDAEVSREDEDWDHVISGDRDDEHAWAEMQALLNAALEGRRPKQTKAKSAALCLFELQVSKLERLLL